jgi:hypothetical protein
VGGEEDEWRSEAEEGELPDSIDGDVNTQSGSDEPDSMLGDEKRKVLSRDRTRVIGFVGVPCPCSPRLLIDLVTDLYPESSTLARLHDSPSFGWASFVPRRLAGVVLRMVVNSFEAVTSAVGVAVGLGFWDRNTGSHSCLPDGGSTAVMVVALAILKGAWGEVAETGLKRLIMREDSSEAKMSWARAVASLCTLRSAVRFSPRGRL